MKTKSFDNVKDQVGFCGIWCGSCVVGNGILKELTKEYELIVEKYGLEEWASEGYDFNEFRKGLDHIRDVKICPGCLKGGGRDNCEIKACATSRKLEDCGACEDFMVCKNSEILKKMREGARDAGLLVKDKNVDQKHFMKKAIRELEKKSPHCILFCKT
jgi:hypothetical protein